MNPKWTKQHKIWLLKDRLVEDTLEIFSVGIGSKLEMEERHSQNTTQSYLVNIKTDYYTFINQLLLQLWGLRVLAEFLLLTSINRSFLCVKFVYSICDIIIYNIHTLWLRAFSKCIYHCWQQQIWHRNVPLIYTEKKLMKNGLFENKIFFFSSINPFSNYLGFQSHNLYYSSMSPIGKLVQ